MADEPEWIAQDLYDKTAYTGFGVYKIRLFRDEKPVRIHRFQGVDETGLLLIGRSVDIDRRRRQFVNSSKGRHGHSEGIQWYLVTRFSEIDKQTSLRFEFVKLESERKAKERERVELQDYFERYLETPPLNAAIPKRKEWFDELRDRSIEKPRKGIVENVWEELSG